MDAEYYFKDDVAYERVTRILDYFTTPELVDWKVRVGKKEAGRIARVATKFGSRVHEIIETGCEVSKKDGEEVRNCIKAFNSWRADFANPELNNGKTLFCEKRKIAGTPDAMWGSVLIDFKTSREVKASHFVQLGAYASLMEEKPKSLAILRLDKQLGIYEWVTNEKIGVTVDQCMASFNYLLGYYRFYNMVQSAIKPNMATPEGEEDEP